jgi:hypothetical protein
MGGGVCRHHQKRRRFRVYGRYLVRRHTLDSWITPGCRLGCKRAPRAPSNIALMGQTPLAAGQSHMIDARTADSVYLPLQEGGRPAGAKPRRSGGGPCERSMRLNPHPARFARRPPPARGRYTTSVSRSSNSRIRQVSVICDCPALAARGGEKGPPIAERP